MRNSRGKSRRYAYNARGTLQNIIKVQNASLIYQRDQPENIFGIKKSSANTIWQNISYTTSFADSNNELSSNSSTDDACLFGNDGFSFDDPSSTWNVYYIDPSIDPFSSSCNDPFGGMWGYEGGGFGGLEPGGEAETCEQCRNRQAGMCWQTRDSCIKRAFGVGTAATVLCGALPPPLDIICVIVTVGAGIDSMRACDSDYNVCLSSIIDKCPQCNK